MGMGIGLTEWVITTRSNKKFYNKRNGAFMRDVTEQCLFPSYDKAKAQLDQMDFGYVIKPAKVYRDIAQTKIRLTS